MKAEITPHDAKKSEDGTFENWWYNEGSGIGMQKGEDVEESHHRLTRIAWENATYKAEEKAEALKDALRIANEALQKAEAALYEGGSREAELESEIEVAILTCRDLLD